MFKNKKINYLLAPLVLGIWVMAIVRIVHHDKPAGRAEGSTVDTSWVQPVVSIDSFSLRLDYRDPFLSQPMATSTPEVAGPPSQAFRSRPAMPAPAVTGPHASKLQRQAPLQLAEMRYAGGVRLPGSGKLTGVLYLNSLAYRVRKGDSIMGFKLLDVQLDSVTIAYGDSSWVLSK